MAAKLHIIEQPEDDWDTKPGDMWLCPNTNESHTVEGRGPCWIIRLPGKAFTFHTNMESSDGGFWEVSGEPPNITIQPSIKVGNDIWHGFITNGEMTP